MSTLLQRAARAAQIGDNDDSVDVSRETLTHIPAGDVADNPYQERAYYTALPELAADIQQNGLLQPPRRRRAADGTVQLAFGHRRLRAARLAGMDSFPVHLRDLTDQQMAEYAWSENDKREDTTAVEKARHIQRAIADFEWTQAQAAERFGIARSTVANLLRLLSLPENVQSLVEERKLDQRHARALLPLADEPETLAAVAANAVEQGQSARDLEETVADKRRAIDTQREEQRQRAAVDALGLGVAWADDESLEFFRTTSPWANSGLLDKGACGPGICDCLRLRFLPDDDWRMQMYGDGLARPCPEDAANVCYGCCASDQARRKWQGLQAEQNDDDADTETDDERRRREEEQAEQIRRQADERQRLEEAANGLVAAFVAKHDPADLWIDTRFWRWVVGTYPFNLLAIVAESLAAGDMAAVQFSVINGVLVRRRWQDDLGGRAVDLEATAKNRDALLAALAE